MKQLGDVIEAAKAGNEYARLYVWALSGMVGAHMLSVESDPVRCTKFMHQANLSMGAVENTMLALGREANADYSDTWRELGAAKKASEQ